MAIVDLCNKALRKNHQYETLSAMSGNTTKAGKLCEDLYDDARLEVLRLAPWTCIIKRETLEHDTITGTLTSGSTTVSSVSSGDIAKVTAGYQIEGEGIADDTLVSAKSTTSFTISEAATESGVTELELSPANLTGREYSFDLPTDFISRVGAVDDYGTDVDLLIEGQHAFTSDTDEPILIYIFDSEDPDVWDPLLREAVITQLASKLAYPLTGSHENEIAFAQAAQAMAMAAIQKSRRERRTGPSASAWWMPGLFTDRIRQ